MLTYPSSIVHARDIPVLSLPLQECTSHMTLAKSGVTDPFTDPFSMSQTCRRSWSPRNGRVRFPKKDSGRCLEADYELLGLLPTKRSPAMLDATRIPPWLSQR
eukprot:8125874-Pyramimonas_sp.AAC.1